MNKRPGFRKRIALELFRSLKKNRAKLHELHTLYWECTLRCNLNCRHCGSECHVSSSQADMPMADFLKVIDDITPLVNPANVQVKLTGGEPLVRNDLEQCGKELSQRGYPWGIVTNGLALTRQRLDTLLDAGMRFVTISLDGFEEAHNGLRSHPESFSRAVDAICFLEEKQGVRWEVSTSINQKNFSDLPLFKKFLEELGVKQWRLTTITPSEESPKTADLQLSSEQFTSLLSFIRQCRNERAMQVSYSCEGFLGSYEAEVRSQLHHCTAGINTASVLADGSISGCPCIRSGFRQGNIYADPFTEIWENKFKPYRNREWARKGQCLECSMFRYCEGGGMHLHDSDGKLQTCHYKRITSY